ncbi:hypothetical protein STEG23_029489, partial [Scotinomys teguina]
PALRLVSLQERKKASRRLSQDFWKLVRLRGSAGVRPALRLIVLRERKTGIEETVSRSLEV